MAGARSAASPRGRGPRCDSARPFGPACVGDGAAARGVLTTSVCSRAARRHGPAVDPAGAAAPESGWHRGRACIADRDALVTSADHPGLTGAIVVHAIAVVVERVTHFHGWRARAT